MTRSGIPQRLQSRTILAPDSSIFDSFGAPRLMWMETASAPSAIASSTVQTSTLSFGSGLSEVLPERCTKSPMSRPCRRCPLLTIPLWRTIAFAPPSLTSVMTFVMSRRPSIWPMENPWSMGIITALPVFLSIILSILISFPIMISTSPVEYFQRLFDALVLVHDTCRCPDELVRHPVLEGVPADRDPARPARHRAFNQFQCCAVIRL